MDDGVDRCSSDFGLVVRASSILGSLPPSPKPLLVPKTITTSFHVDRVARLFKGRLHFKKSTGFEIC
jgi:hypothetical protein